MNDHLSEANETEIRKAITEEAPLPDVPDWDKFQTWVMSKARKFDSEEKAQLCSALGLAGEGGEFADMIKKHVFHNRPSSSQEKASELGDVLFYIAQASAVWGIPLSLVVKEVMVKLDHRYPSGFTVEKAHGHRAKDGDM